MTAITLWGHGKFYLETDPPIIEVPAGSAIYFFIDYMKIASRENDNMLRVMSEDELINRRPDCSQQAIAGQTVLNMTLSPETWDETFEQLNAGAGTQLVTVQEGTTLQGLFDQYPNCDIYWTTCRSVDLDYAGGASLQVNAPQSIMWANSSSQWDADPAIGQIINSWQPQGVAQCTALCGTCGSAQMAACIIYDGHIDQYQHKCEYGHRWGDTDGYDSEEY